MIKLNIQLFADGEEAVDTTTETQEVETKENEIPTEDENVEFTDASESKETEESKVDDAETQAKIQAEEEAKRKEAERKAQNKRYAEQRLREKQEKEKQKLERDAYIRGLKASTKGVNPYTNKPIEDEFDVKEYETMMELEKQGKDPIDDYQDYVKQLQRKSKQEEEQKAKAAEEEKTRSLNDFQEFANKYGIDTAKKLNKDKDWLEVSNKILEKPTMSNIYNAYQYMQKIADEKVQKALEKANAKKAVQTGNHNSLGKVEKDILSMSDEEFKAYSRKIRGVS